MNTTDKKLDALIDALGFDVEEVDVNPRRHDRYPSEPIYDYKLTKRGVPVVDEPKTHIWMGTYAVANDEPVNHEWTVDTNTGYDFSPDVTLPYLHPSTVLKHKLLTILKKAGKCPKKDTITLINHEIDLAFNMEIMLDE